MAAESALRGRDFSSCGEQGLLSSNSVWAAHCGDFSCCTAGVGSCGAEA